VVGQKSVWHVDINSSEECTKIFDRAPQLANCQIMSYDVDAAEQWCFLVGLYSLDQKNINAYMQLYNIERKAQ
jgi:hypothetical protein